MAPGEATRPISFDPITHRYCTNCDLYKLRKGFSRINKYRTICQDCNKVRIRNMLRAKAAFALRRAAV